MVGSGNALETTLGFSPTDPERLLRSLRLFIDGGKRGVAEASLGSANLLYITLKVLELERYLDVTRGEILFAKGVVLVEGDTETFLVPAFARLQGLDLDALGISVCSVGGTNFAPYVKSLGPEGLNLPFAVLTDFDPTTKGSRGERRVCNLLEALGKSPDKTTGEALRKEAAASGIFLNDYTLEGDVFKCGRHNSVDRTLIELAESKPAEERAEGWKKDPDTLDVDAFLADINAIGKGRFAQRLATNMGKGPCPAYMEEALAYVAARCR